MASRGIDPFGLALRVGDTLAVLPNLAYASIDFVATDPPYNMELPLTMAGGQLPKSFADRRTDYGMKSEAPADIVNAPDYGDVPRRMPERPRAPGPRAAGGPVRGDDRRDAYQDGRYQFAGADLAARAGGRLRPRAT